MAGLGVLGAVAAGQFIRRKRANPRGDAAKVWALLAAACDLVLVTAVPTTLTILVLLLSIGWSDSEARGE